MTPLTHDYWLKTYKHIIDNPKSTPLERDLAQMLYAITLHPENISTYLDRRASEALEATE